MRQEFARVYPDLDALLEVLQQEFHRYESMDEVLELIGRKKPELLERHSGRALLETLFDTSVIGFRLRDSGAVRYKSEDLDLLLPAEAAVYVHQSLRKGLNVVERRARAPTDDQPDDDQLEIEIC